METPMIKILKITNKIHHLFFLTAKTREGTRRNKAIKKHFYKKFLGIKNPFYKLVFGRRRQWKSSGLST